MDFDGEIPDSEKTPVTIVTGFLGSGKTTLVNYILKEQNDWKIAVVENEFGEVAIDNSLVEENLAAKEDIIMMDNGCVCCSVRGDLVRTFGMLADRRKEFQAVLLETTGLADPGPICFTFNSNATIQDNYRIDSVVCLVDAKHVNIHLDEEKPDGDINEAEHQIAFADRILLNKTDLVSAEELDDVVDRIRSINSFATIVKTERSRAPLDQVLGLNTFSLDKLNEIDPTIMDEPEPEPHTHSHDHAHGSNESCSDAACTHESHDHSHGHAHGHAHEHEDHAHGADCKEEACTDKSHDHSHGHAHAHEDHAPKPKKKRHNLSLVSSVGFTIKGLLDVTLFNVFMSNLLATKANDLYRTKGVLAFEDQDDKFVFQGVHEQINFGPSEKGWAEGEERASKLVFIGKNLDYDFLKKSISECATDPSTVQVKMHKRA